MPGPAGHVGAVGPAGPAGARGVGSRIRVVANTVIGGVDVVGVDHSAAVATTGSFRIDPHARVETAWYVPIDNLHDLTSFQRINAVVVANNEIEVTFRPNAPGVSLRILVYAALEE